MATLIQVCNVAEVMGGTGACAWTVTRALPGWRHVVVFPRAAREEVAREFGPAEVRAWPVVTAARVREVAAESARRGVRGGVVVLLHNAGVGRVEGTLPAVVLQYVHSPIRAAGADSVRYCSQHLAARERGRALFGEEAMARRLVGWVREAAAEAAQVKSKKAKVRRRGWGSRATRGRPRAPRMPRPPGC